MKLNLRRAARRRLPKRERVALYVPQHPDTVWSMDFMSDALACGRRFRTFNVVDDFNPEALHIEVDTSITSARLVRIFEQIKRDHGLPQVIRSDNGPESRARASFKGSRLTAWPCDTSSQASLTRTRTSSDSIEPPAKKSSINTCSLASKTYAKQRIGG
jgi:putative transposase